MHLCIENRLRERKRGRKGVCFYFFVFIFFYHVTSTYWKKAELKYNDKFIHLPKQLPLPHRFYIYFFNRIHFWPMCYSPVSPDLTLSSARGLCKKYPSNFFLITTYLLLYCKLFFLQMGKSRSGGGGRTGGARTLRCSFLSIFFFFG